jgi:hypothetical protein
MSAGDTTYTKSEERVPEETFSDSSIASMRLKELERDGVESFSFQAYNCMLSAVQIVRNTENIHLLPTPIQIDIELKLYGVFKSIQNAIKDLSSDFKNIAKQQIDTFLEVQEAKQLEEKEQREKELKKKTQELLKGKSKE